jgi:ribosome-associated translation inhibitor RaiA
LTQTVRGAAQGLRGAEVASVEGMQTDLQISFHGVPSSPSVESYVRTRAEKLERHFARLTGCRVVIEAPHRAHRHGGHYMVRIELGVPGRELVVARDPAAHKERADLYACVEAAFDDARRLLDDHSGQQLARRRGRKEAHHERGTHRV